MQKVLLRVAEYMRSTRFYRLILAIFLIEAVWIAVSAAYPQAFDENYHFGLIKVFSHYWLPFLTNQPPHADAYGAVARTPSFLYHYLMSFPYRLIELFVKKQIIQVIILRLINVGLFVYGITLFRKVLLRVGSSKLLTNLILILFIFIPIVPQLAAQINYDNLLIPLTAAMILLSFRLMDELRAKKVSIWTIVLFLGSCLLTSLVKYAFLPIFAGMVLFLLVVLYKNYKDNFRLFFQQLESSWRQQSKLAKITIVFLAIVPLGMFSEMDLANLVMYHSIQPSCSKVISIKQCMAYSPWAYNYKNHQKIINATNPVNFNNPVIYTFQWLYWMWYRLFFAINGPGGHFKNYPPLPLPSAATFLLVIAGIVALFKWWRKIFADNIYLLMIAVIVASYTIALMGQGYFTYLYTDVLENMNGRYLVPILLLAAAILGQALSLSFKKQSSKILVAIIVLIFFFEGGGVITFIARSEPSWYVHNKVIVKVNNTARKVIKHVVIKGSKKYSTPVWFFN
jgi:hypothetical protein